MRLAIILSNALLIAGLLIGVAHAQDSVLVGRVSRYQAPLEFQESSVTEASLAGARCVVSGDADGDGRDELFVLDGAGSEIRLLEFTTRLAVTARPWAHLQAPSRALHCVAGDFSGDQRADLALMEEGGREWLFLISQSSGDPERHRSTFDVPASTPLSIRRIAAIGGRDAILFSSAGEGLMRWVRSGAGELMWYYRWPDWKVEATGDFSGHGGGDVVFKRLNQASSWRLLHPSSESPGAMRSNFNWLWPDDAYQWQFEGAGDFNGDGLDDALLFGGVGLGWWVGVSDTGQAVPQPVRGLSRGRVGAVVGDYDGDGLADIVSRAADTTLWMGWSKGMPGLPGVTVTASSGRAAVTDASGSYSLTVAPDEQLRASKEGFVFSQASLAAQRRNGLRRKRADFVATEVGEGAKVVGRSELLGPQRGAGPYVCIGFNPGQGVEGWGEVHDSCPRGYAYFSFREPGRIETKPERVAVGGACCRLPAEDVLTEERVKSFGACPENFIGVGGDYRPPDHHALLCARINTERYQLGPVTGGRYFGVGYSMAKHRTRIESAALPVALRYALGRSSYDKWIGEGCVGVRPGYLVTGKQPRTCETIEFRELQYAGRAGDPPAGTPVEMLPKCSKIENEFDAFSGCFPEAAD